MALRTAVLRESGGYWVALCLENGIVGQGESKDTALKSLAEAIDSFEDAQQSDPEIASTPILIKELHEFLTFEDKDPAQKPFELRTLYA